jgi:hypothetical protein
MAGYLGNNAWNNVYLGSNAASEVYLGSTKVWPVTVVSGSIFIGNYTGTQAELEGKLTGETLTSWAIVGSDTVASSSTAYSVNLNAFSASTITKYIDDGQCTVLNNIAFQYSQNLVTASFAGCTTLGSGVFTSCSQLRVVDFPELITLGSNGFVWCTSLQSVSLPKVKTVGQSAFRFCSAISSISLPSLSGSTALGGSTGSNNVFDSCSLSGTITVPAYLATVASGQPDGDLQYLKTAPRNWTINYI